MLMKQEIPWNRLAVEAFVIVASILLAFAIDAWWTRYQESIEEQELLTGLRAEFLVNQELVAKKISVLQTAQENLRLFLRMNLDEVEKISPDEAMRMVVHPTHRSYTSDGMTHAFLSATINSGKLAVIDSARLQAALIDTEVIESTVTLIEDDIRELTDRGMIELAKYWELLPELWDSGNVHKEISGSTLSALRANNDLMALNAAKAQRLEVYINSHQRMLDHLKHVVELIDQEI